MIMKRQQICEKEYKTPLAGVVQMQPENVLCQSTVDVASNTESVGKDTEYTFEW